MLTTCPECNGQISDKASVCPHCGYPLSRTNKRESTKKSSKRRRLPNGFGRITKITGKYLRCPYRVMVTVGKDPNGKPIGKLLKPHAYFKTYNEAYQALMEYHSNPYDLDDVITARELYTRWSEHHFTTLKSSSSRRTIESAWRYSSALYDMPVRAIRARHIKTMIDEASVMNNGELKTATPGIKTRMKSMWNLMLDYALEYELVDRNYARSFELSKDITNEKESKRKDHMIYTDDELERLFSGTFLNNYNIVKDTTHSFEEFRDIKDMIVVQLYSGWRPSELCELRLENINLDEETMTGGMKTASGINRVVPIHPAIFDIVVHHFTESSEIGSDYLFTFDGSPKKISYDTLNYRFKGLKEALKLDKKHRLHDGRKHFITMAKKGGVDEYAIKRLVGHSITDVTEKIYTQRDIDWLRNEIKKIPNVIR